MTYAVTIAFLWLIIGAAVWRARRPKAPSFSDISKALDADIAAAEARGVVVNRNDRIAPRKRISF